ncbi:Holliday junction resolvase RuvX [Rubrivirga sp. SAORIC476]|uniref:Holliday junction resolvase RuvX n=1 Tax=Rubrivirga sp. SAORIC476 TaxID=1961794 RepID=UPI000BA90C82|nr:Holliday junction resolvase RuvX [Rubrivirga sp. SAORIC476]PAP74913.1 Holliday junction resolvase RuvX [Rubrivirga sp. SAORIC476]
MTSQPRVAGVDYGDRRVGIALADPLRLFARPLGTFPPGEALRELARLVTDEGVGVLVVGWPLADDGGEGAAVDRVRPFLGRLKKAAPDAEVVLQDERDSSRRAVDDLVAAGVSRKRRREKGTIDAAAACVILQDWLDEQAG